MVRYLVTVVVFSAFIQVSYAQEDRWFVNPGIKIGIAFGKNSGAVLGGEISVGKFVVRDGFDQTMSIVIGASHCYNQTRNVCGYAELEYGSMLGGCSLGGMYNSFFKETDPYLRVFAGFRSSIGYGVDLSYLFAIGALSNEFSVIGNVPYNLGLSE